MPEQNPAFPAPPIAMTAPPKPKPATPTETKDSLREIVETIVFVVVLVLLLKSFVAEAFVIPTGSMAETLYGYQKIVVCPKCQYEFPVNCSSEVDPQQEASRAPVEVCTCPNCRYDIDFKNENMSVGWNSGDRVLVAKFLYDLGVLGMNQPNRFDVVVFKYPESPQRDYTAMNYIKRLIGISNESIGIHYGDIYRRQHSKDAKPFDDSEARPQDLWRKQYMHPDEEVELFLKELSLEPNERKFQIVRKPPAQMLAERRIVFNNDHQPKDLVGKITPRWSAESQFSPWKPDKADEPKRFSSAPGDRPEVSWLRYQHLMPTTDRFQAQKKLITDFMGYNTWRPAGPDGQRRYPPPAENWVGDLMVECEVEVKQPQGDLWLELSKGVDRFQARWDLSSGRCTLVRVSDGREEVLDGKDTQLKKSGKFRLRFANFDERLTVWVDGSMPFGDGVAYDPPRQRGPTNNDLEPVSIGTKAATLDVTGLKIWRDTYYTVVLGNEVHPDAGVEVDLGQPSQWEPLREIRPRTFYVQPGHYLCLGDNSPHSSDGRSWGLVPERLLLGRALGIYWPYNRVGKIQ